MTFNFSIWPGEGKAPWWRGERGGGGAGNQNRLAQRASVLSGSGRWVNKGRKEKQARIQRRSRGFASSGVVITMGADTFPLLIWWDEEFLTGHWAGGGGGGWGGPVTKQLLWRKVMWKSGFVTFKGDFLGGK